MPVPAAPSLIHLQGECSTVCARDVSIELRNSNAAYVQNLHLWYMFLFSQKSSSWYDPIGGAAPLVIILMPTPKPVSAALLIDTVYRLAKSVSGPFRIHPRRLRLLDRNDVAG